MMVALHNDPARSIGMQKYYRLAGNRFVSVLDVRTLDFQSAVVEDCEVMSLVQFAFHFEAGGDCVGDWLPRSSM